MKNALTAPITAPTTITVTTVGKTARSAWVLSTATSIDDSAMVPAIDRSKSPAVSGMMKASASTTSIAWLPNMTA